MAEGRVLLAEDDEGLRGALVLMLASEGYEVAEAGDGEAALTALMGGGFDLLVTDLMMPGMAGEELIGRLAGIPPTDRPAVIVLTAHKSVESAIRGIKAGISAYIGKPFDTAELITAVRDALERRRLDRELRRYYDELDRKVEERTREIRALSDENARLYDGQKALAEGLLRKVNQLVILNEMGHLIRVSHRLDEAAMVVVSAIVEGIGFDRVCMWLLDERGENLTLTACHGLEGAAGRTLPASSVLGLPLNNGDAVMASGSICDPSVDAPGGPEGVVMAPLVTRNPENAEVRCWEHFGCGQEACPAYRNPALTCWIIKDSCQRRADRGPTLLDKMAVCRECHVYKTNRRGRTIGILCADNGMSGRAITPDDMNALNVFAGSAAVIIENLTLMERLIKNERFIDSIIFNMSSGLLVTDREGRVVMLNYAGAEILRRDRREMIGRDFAAALPEAGRFLVVDDEPAISHEASIPAPEGPIPVGYSNSYLIGHGGTPDGVIVVFRDLSEIKKLHDQLREKDRFAAIGKVAAGVAHEIRNPLFGITSVAQILARETKGDTPKKALIDAMLSETSRLNTLVEDMLLYGRTMKAAPQPTDLNALIESVLDFHAAGIREKDLAITRDFSRDIPSIMLDPHQMRQVFLNILVNALDASRRGGRVDIKTRMSVGKVMVTISDDGAGIPGGDLPKVFDLFYTTKEKGTGLGLAICRKIIEDHGGSISINSAPGRGTTMDLVLPLHPGA